MAEELLEYENTIEDAEGRSWTAEAMGAERGDGTWVGWILFREVDGDTVLETDRETTQPNRPDLVYWTTGLTYFYLEGALARARRASDRAKGRDAQSTAGTGSQASKASDDRIPAETGPRLRVSGAEGGVINEIMGVTEPRPGSIREVPGAGAVVYEGGGKGEGVHSFRLRFGSRNGGAVLSNWLWSRLRGSGAVVHVDGEKVELSQDAISHAVVGE